MTTSINYDSSLALAKIILKLDSEKRNGVQDGLEANTMLFMKGLRDFLEQYRREHPEYRSTLGMLTISFLLQMADKDDWPKIAVIDLLCESKMMTD